MRWLLALALLAAWPVPGVGYASAAEQIIEGLASVGPTGELRLGGREVVLAGIEIAPTPSDCRTWLRPARCGPRALLVLGDMLEGFVHCRVVRQFGGSRVEGVCTLRGERMLGPRKDIAERLLAEGWAFARDDAPLRYRKLEEVARRRGLGIWSDDGGLIR